MGREEKGNTQTDQMPALWALQNMGEEMKDDIPQELHDEIILIGKKIWNELRDECNERDIVGELKEIDMEYDSKIYKLAIDCYWDRSNYFDYHIKGDGIDCRKLVACYM